MAVLLFTSVTPAFNAGGLPRFPVRFCSSSHSAHLHPLSRLQCSLSTSSPLVDVLVVGGGASGIFSAIAAARAGASVLVLEAGTTPLAKVRISGGGRCNVMHDQATWDPRGCRDLLEQRYPRGAPQLTGPLSKRFSPPDTALWFEAEGVTLKSEEDGRVFPSTDDSATIVNALLSAAERAGVRVKLRCRVTGVERVTDAIGADGLLPGFRVAVKEGRETEAPPLLCRALILATGSTSHSLASALGHEVSPLVPSLFSFRLKAGAILDASLAGVTVQDVQLTLASLQTSQRSLPAKGKSPVMKGQRRRAAISARGPLLITHRGLSGPAALKLSAFGALSLAQQGYRGTLELNLVPNLSRAEAAAALAAFRARVPLKAIGNANPFNVPKRLWNAIVCGTRSLDARESKETPISVNRAGGHSGHAIEPSKPWSQASNADLLALEERTCRMSLEFVGKDSNKDEFVTAGGISWTGVDTSRMSSKHVAGLFFAGELLDVDGITGGHNFQSCWTTGFIAGNAAAKLCGCAVAEQR